MSRANSVGRYTQSISPKDICILLVNDDSICRNIVSDMLEHCRYEVLSCEGEMDAVNVIREKKDAIEFILTNVHRTYANRHGIIEHIEKEFKLQIILMSPDVEDMINASRGGGKGVMLYFMKSVTVNEMNNLWATALGRENSKRELSFGKVKEGSKRMRESDEQNGNAEKKPRVVWTKEMHQKFLEAIAQLGHDKAFPKKIVELMNVQGLTRENVASHLQKYRMCMKRAQDGFTGSSYDFPDPFSFNTSLVNFQQSHWNPFQTISRNTTTSHFNINSYYPRSRMPQRTSLLNKIWLKPDHSFRVYGDEKKNVLLSIIDSRMHPNTTFAGFRLTGDGKSVMFGENNHLGIRNVNESCIQSLSVSSLKQQFSYPEMGNDDASHCQSFIASPGTDLAEPVRFNSQMSSLTSLLGVDEPISAILTQLKSFAAPPGFDWNKAASFTCQKSTIMTQVQPFLGQQGIEPEEAASFTQPQSAGLQWPDWADLTPFSPHQQPSGNDANANSEIFSDFSSTSLPPEFYELRADGDDNGFGLTAISVFDELLFDNQVFT